MMLPLTTKLKLPRSALDTTELGDFGKTVRKQIESGDKGELTPGAAEAFEVRESIDDQKETVQVGSTIHQKRWAKLKSIEN